MEKLAKEQGVKFNTNSNVDSICVENGTVNGLVVNGKKQSCDLVLSGADYHHTESLIEKNIVNTLKIIGRRKFLLPHLFCFMLDLIKN